MPDSGSCPPDFPPNVPEVVASVSQSLTELGQVVRCKYNLYIGTFVSDRMAAEGFSTVAELHDFLGGQSAEEAKNVAAGVAANESGM